jgi:3-oxoacyl-[acyl-carrier protein] reductase
VTGSDPATTATDPTRLTSLSRSIDGEVAIVTGAASGMGRATAMLFADEGARVVVADLGADRVAAVVEEIRAVHGTDRALGVECDVADLAQLRSLVDAAVGWGGRLDIVVNNAGVSLVTSAFQDEAEFDDNWARTLDVNLTAHARLVRLALPYLVESGVGRIVNIASTESIVATGGLAAYAASKAGVAGLTRSLAVELGRHGITVNCICPGPIDTAMTATIPDDAKATYARRRVPMRRYGLPEEVAHMTLNLCLPASSFVNGATIPVDGGMTVRHT